MVRNSRSVSAFPFGLFQVVKIWLRLSLEQAFMKAVATGCHPLSGIRFRFPRLAVASPGLNPLSVACFQRRQQPGYRLMMFGDTGLKSLQFFM